MSECEKCNGIGEIPCSVCEGKKTEPCKKCTGTGKVSCGRCDGHGRVSCGSCYGTGKKVCPVCYKGKVKKTRWINCSRCGGDGRSHEDGCVCRWCDGRGQVEETYFEICPNCHGDYSNYSKAPCDNCKGNGVFICSTCHGEKKIECKECKGTGHLQCSHCKGRGTEKCPDCEKREKEQAEQKRLAEERKRREEERKRREKKSADYRRQQEREAVEKAAKERKDAIQGCGCLLAIVAVVGFFVWWWWEGFTMAALPGMWGQVKNALGGGALGTITKVGGAVVVALLIVSSLIKGIKGKKGKVSTSSKKRWKFVVLGLLLGFFGIHLAYAKRWFLFLLLWTGFITGNVMSGPKANSENVPAEMTAQQVQTESKPSKGGSSPISGIGFGIWALLWIGGTLFIKKDGKNRM